MSSKSKKILGLEFDFVYRYRFAKNSNESLLNSFTIWRNWELGFFFKRCQIVGRKNFNKPKEWSMNHVYMYTFGINLLIWKMWFTVNNGGMTLELKIDKK